MLPKAPGKLMLPVRSRAGQVRIVGVGKVFIRLGSGLGMDESINTLDFRQVVTSSLGLGYASRRHRGARASVCLKKCKESGGTTSVH